MNQHQLLAELFRRGVKVWADGGQLRVRAPKGALTPELRDSLAAQKQEILSAVSSMNVATRAPHAPLVAVSRNGSLPLSSNQQRLWSLAQFRPDSPVYNLCKTLRLDGPLNVPALERSIREIAQRHEILRSRFPVVEGQPVQIVSPDISAQLPVADLRELHAAERQDRVQQLASTESRQSFDLAQGPLLRVKLLQLGDEEHLFFLTVHHLVFDGWSFNVFCRELAALYAAFSAGKPSPLRALPVQYADFAHWEQQNLRHETLNAQLDYWKRQLGGNVAALELPLDRPRVQSRTSDGARQSLVLPEKLTGALKALGRREESTLFMVLLAAFQTLLHGYTGQEDIIVCSPVSGRQRSGTQQSIGYFSRLLPMRADLSGNPDFREVLGRVRRVVWEAYEHQDVPLQRLAAFPELSHTPLSRAMFLLQNSGRFPELPGLSANLADVHNGAADFDLSLSMEEIAATLSGVFEYKTDLFEAATINRMTRHFHALLERIAANPGQRISELGLPLRPDRKPGGHAPPVPERIKPPFIAPRDELELQLSNIWQRVFRRKSIGVKDDFFELGGHSLLAVRLLADIEVFCGKQIPIATLLHATTIEQLANLLRQHEWTPRWSSLVAIRPEGTRPPFFCVHGLGGNVLNFRDLVAHLDPDQPFYGLQSKGLDGKETPYTRIDQMAAHYLQVIRAVQPEGPYYLGGFSGGGVVAFEMAQQLHAQAQQVALLVLLDTRLPRPALRPPSWTLVSKNPIAVANSAAARAYVPQAYPGRVTLFRAEGDLPDTSLGWNPFVPGGIRVCQVPGGHVSILDEPHVRVLAAQLQASLDEAMNHDIRQDQDRKPGNLPAP